MREASPSPSLLVFTRGVERETRRRRLLPSRLAAVERDLHRGCLQAALAAGRETGCAITISSQTPVQGAEGVRQVRQTDGGFGDRLRLAMKGARRRAREPLVVVGTDAPGLLARHLREALSRLAEDPDAVVVGPSPDGGFYLLASRRPLDEILQEVAWRRRGALCSLLAALAREGISASLLEPLVDLDEPQDLARWASGAATGPWLKLIGLVRTALARISRPPAPRTLGRRQDPLASPRLGRAPPLAA